MEKKNRPTGRPEVPNSGIDHKVESVRNGQIKETTQIVKPQVAPPPPTKPKN